MNSELLHPVITSLASVISAAIGVAATRIFTKRSYRREMYLSMYTDCYSPIYHLLFPEIQKISKQITGKNAFVKPPLSALPSNSDIIKYRVRIQMMLSDKSFCPSDLLSMTNSLERESFAKYCLFIKDNYYDLQYKLRIISPKGDRSMTVRRITNIFLVIAAVIILAASVVGCILYFTSNPNVVVKIYLYTLPAMILWILIADRYM